MPTYPNQKYDFQSACIQLDDEIQLGDTLCIKLGGNVQSHPFNIVQVMQFKTNPDFELYLLDCRITYDMEWHYFYLESLFRNHKLDYAYIKRDKPNKLTNGTITPSTPPKISFDLQSYIPAIGDIIDYYINNISYYYILDKTRISELYTETGYKLNSSNHTLKVEESYLGRTLYLIAGLITDTFTGPASLTDHRNYNSLVSTNIVKSTSPSVFFEVKDLLRSGDVLTIVTNNNTYTHTFTDSDLDTLLGTWNLSTPNYNIRFIPVHYGSLKVYNVQVTLISNTEMILSADILQNQALQYFFCYNIKHNYSVFTSNPIYDTAEEQLFHSRSELDHIKQRCICSLAGALHLLKDPNIHNVISTEAQVIRDKVMDYTIYPNTCSLETKQYIWDTYGPFTSPRPIGSPVLSYIDPVAGQYNQPCLGFFIKLIFKNNVQLGIGNIYLYKCDELTVLSVSPLANSLGNSRTSLIYLNFNQDIKLGYGKIILELVEHSMAVINGSNTVKTSGLITLSLPTNLKLKPGSGFLRLVPTVKI